ncbi:MAG: hypothetical protein GY819_03990 [Planctomycetaceae bacterium]|nr:hypothetical protein [Planctomycetaceae bacterium]MCP4461946.1 hypothetical protein [Planctomycetaceae bacterium]MDG1807644.1 hypothetical protein [Pirellulaceae bacterium]MDG2102694.1 hypothetical protein [Pirellulaceae bacterium]
MQRFFLGVCLLAFVSPAVAQEKTSFGEFTLNAMFDKQVQKELDLVDEQRAEISEQLKGLTEFRNELSVELRDMKSAGGAEQALLNRRDEMREELKAQKKKVESQVLDILLPHQQKRLREVSAQYVNREAMKQNKVNTGLLTPQMLEYLDVDDEQAKRIAKRAEKIRKRLTEKIETLKKEAMEDLMKELSSKQKKKYRDLMGEEFKR